MDKKNSGTVTDDVEVRLEDIFGESGESPAPEEDSGRPEDFPLRGLKPIVMSIDWEINDEIMSGFIEEIGRLEHTYKDDKTSLSFLRLLGSVGKYIKAKKANSHPDSIKLLNSTYNSLEEVFLSNGMTEAEKEQTLLVQVKEFKKLKEQIGLRKAGAREEKAVSPPDNIKPVLEQKEKDVYVQEEIRPAKEAREELTSSDASRMYPHEDFAYALEEIKQVIKAEFRALRAELKLWRERQ